MIITVYNDIISRAVVDSQRKVFEKFGEKLTQIKPAVWEGHAAAVDAHLKNNDWEYAIVVDIDCIPLNKDVIKEARDWVLKNTGLYSVAQNPNHLPGAPDYASPAFIAFSKKTYEELGNPSFQGTKSWDVGGELTYRAREKNILIILMYPSHVEIPKWKFNDGKMFGIGTTYENKVYHHFEGRRITASFLRKCENILK